MTARVRGVDRRSSRRIERVRRPDRRRRAPASRRPPRSPATVGTHVFAAVITSSPGPTPSGAQRDRDRVGPGRDADRVRARRSTPRTSCLERLDARAEDEPAPVQDAPRSRRRARPADASTWRAGRGTGPPSCVVPVRLAVLRGRSRASARARRRARPRLPAELAARIRRVGEVVADVDRLAVGRKRDEPVGAAARERDERARRAPRERHELVAPTLKISPSRLVARCRRAGRRSTASST